jgi:hypothetical protein
VEHLAMFVIIWHKRQADWLVWVDIGNRLIPLTSITNVDIRYLQYGWIYITLDTKEKHTVSGLNAIEIVYLLKPSAMEGKRLKWTRNAWVFHNFIGHPVVQILAWMGFKKQAIQFHDWTTPKPLGFKDDKDYI